MKANLIGHPVGFGFQQGHFVQTLFVEAVDEEAEFLGGGSPLHPHPLHRNQQLEQGEVLLEHHHGDVSKYSSGGGVRQLLGTGLGGTHCKID